MPSLVAPATAQVIVCDDDEDIRDFLCCWLQQSGYEPLSARDSRDIEHFLTHKDPRVLLLDIAMSDQDGFEIAERLKRTGQNIPVIFITAHDNKFCRIYSPLLGAAGYFTKPLDTDALLQRISETIQERLKQSATE